VTSALPGGLILQEDGMRAFYAGIRPPAPLRGVTACAFAALALAPQLCAAGEASLSAAGNDQAAGPEEFTDDLVIMKKTGLALQGKVVRVTKDNVVLLVEYGTLTLPRVAIERIEFNLRSRLAELAEDDYAGRYAAACSAFEMGQADAARPVLEGLVGRDGVPLDVHEKLARIYESEGQLGKALKHLKEYALARRDDEALKARIADLAARAGGDVAAGGDIVGTAVANPAVKEGLEVGGAWEVFGWGNPAQAVVQPIEGNQTLMVNVAANGQQDKAAVGRQVRLDFSAARRLTFRAFNGEKSPVRLAVAIVTPSSYYESRPVTLLPGWNTGEATSVDVASDKWKCQATNWAFSASIAGLDSVRQIIFLVYSGKQKALLYLDSIGAE